MGPVETRRGEGAFSSGTHLASHLRHLQTPKCRVGPRARCVSSLRVLTSVVLRKSPDKRFFFYLRTERKRSLFSAGILRGFYVYHSGSLAREQWIIAESILKRTCLRDGLAKSRGKSEGTVKNSDCYHHRYHRKGFCHRRDFSRARVTRAVLIKVLVKTRYSRVCRKEIFSSENRIFTCEERAREERQEEEEVPLHRLLENPACLSILAFKDDRVKREIAVAPELSLWVQWLLLRRFIFTYLYVLPRESCGFTMKKILGF